MRCRQQSRHPKCHRSLKQRAVDARISAMSGYERAGAEINVAIGGEGPPLLSAAWQSADPCQLAQDRADPRQKFHRRCPRPARLWRQFQARRRRGPFRLFVPRNGQGQCRAHVALSVSIGFRWPGMIAARALHSAWRSIFLIASSAWRHWISCPTYHALTNVTLGWGLEAYHWFFMAQKAPFPEKLLTADLDYYIDYKLNKKGVGLRYSARRRWRNTSAARRLSRSMRCAKTIARPSASISPWTRPTSASARSTARCWLCGVPTAIAAVISSRSRHGGPGRRTCAAGRCRPGHYPAEQRPDLVYDAFWTILQRPGAGCAPA